jgi:hypothetical protein
MKVTSMDRRGGPINRSTLEAVITSEVSLEPVDSVVPEISPSMFRLTSCSCCDNCITRPSGLMVPSLVCYPVRTCS